LNILFIVDVLRIFGDEPILQVAQILGEDATDAAVDPGIYTRDTGTLLVGPPKGIVCARILGCQLQVTHGRLAELVGTNLPRLAVAVVAAVRTAAEAFAICVAVEAVVLNAFQAARAVTICLAIATGH